MEKAGKNFLNFQPEPSACVNSGMIQSLSLKWDRNNHSTDQHEFAPISLLWLHRS